MLDDVFDNRERFSGNFTAFSPLDGMQITWGFTTIEQLPFFISQCKTVDGELSLTNSIAFTENEFAHFIKFMRLLLKQPTTEGSKP